MHPTPFQLLPTYVFPKKFYKHILYTDDEVYLNTFFYKSFQEFLLTQKSNFVTIESRTLKASYPNEPILWKHTIPVAKFSLEELDKLLIKVPEKGEVPIHDIFFESFIYASEKKSWMLYISSPNDIAILGYEKSIEHDVQSFYKITSKKSYLKKLDEITWMFSSDSNRKAEYLTLLQENYDFFV